MFDILCDAPHPDFTGVTCSLPMGKHASHIPHGYLAWDASSPQPWNNEHFIMPTKASSAEESKATVLHVAQRLEPEFARARAAAVSDAERARDEAIAQVERGAPRDWMEDATSATMFVAMSRSDFTTDDVWSALGGSSPLEPRAMGAVINGLANAGKIEATGEYRKSVRVECHARPVAVWRLAAQ